MSFYASIQGYIKYPNENDMESVIKIITDGGWLKDNRIIDECGEPIGEENDVDYENLIISIPLGLHRNLSQVNFFTDGATGIIVCTSTEFGFHGWTIKDGNETVYDLTEWAKKNVEEPEPDAVEIDKYLEWQYEVELGFFEEMSP